MIQIRIHERVQHPVGQGFFHSGLVHGADGTLHYVVDCGSMKKYSTARKSSIRSYISFMKERSRERRLDVLFITHMHVDHVNGIEELLDPRNGLRVDTIVMPLLNDIDRLIVLAKSYTDDRASADSEFYRAFISDPGSAVSRFNPRRVVFVRSGDGGGGAPGGTDVPPGAPDLDLAGRLDEGPVWKLAGRGRITGYPDESTRAATDGTGMLVVPDTVAAIVKCEAGHWLLAPYVDPGISEGRTKFLQALAKERGLSVRKLKVWLEDRSNLESLLTTDTADLVAAYNSLTADLNVTSLCLYSGPADRSSIDLHCDSYVAESDDEQTRHFWCQGETAGWLGTGDAPLSSAIRRKAFLKHYGRLLENVAVLTLPHHGSDHNFHEDLLKKIRPRLCVAAADRYSNWRHPGVHVVQAVCSHGAAVHVVTSHPLSRLREYVNTW